MNRKKICLYLVKNNQFRLNHNSVLRLLLTVLIFFCSTFLFAEETKITTISIKNARQTSYKKAEDTGNDTILLEGSVELSVQKENTVSEIKADRITYDRKTEMLYAEGNVEIVTKSSGSGGEKTTAKSLLLNTSTLEGVFDGGRVVQTQSDALNLPSGSTLIVFSDLFGKGSANTIAFKNSSLTFCNDDDPHWHIDATRTWLLPGGEFAFFNALLYVGAVPVLYLPAFYYPKDELIFNPVFGYRKREGYFVQTTTYVYGRKPLNARSNTTTTSSSSSDSTNDTSTSAEALKGLYNFVKPSSLKQQKLEGLVLHNLDEDYTGNTSEYVKILGDWYSNLGYLVGFDANFQPSNQYVSRFAFSADIGISNTIIKLDDKYYPFSESGRQYQDKSTFLGVTMPFRYSANLDFALSKPFSVSLSMPIYSDPYYNYDFKTNRMETMDWISYFLENTANKEQKDPSISTTSSFSWQLSISDNLTIPDLFKPYISSLSLKSNSSVSFSTKNTEELYYKGSTDYETAWKSNTPEREFYYPSLITPASVNVSLAGTLFSWPLEQKSAKSKKNYNFPVTLNKPDELKSEKQLQEEAEQKKKEENQEENNGENQSDKKADSENNEEAEDNSETESEKQLFEYYLPDLEYTPAQTSVTNGFGYKLTYNIAANMVNQMSYDRKNLKKSEDFDWKKVQSYMYTLKTPATLTSTMNYGGNFLTVSNGVSYSPIFQKHPYISDDDTVYTKSERDNLILTDYNAESQDVSTNNSVVIKPFSYIDIFSDTSVSWSSSVKLYRRKFNGTVEEPDWETLTVDWDDDKCVTANTLTEVLSAKELNNKLSQKLTFTEILPPLLRQFNASLELGFPYVTGTISAGYQETTKDDVSQEDKWKKNPLQQGVTISVPIFSKTLSLSETYVYNLEDENPDNLKISAAFYGFSVAYTMSYTNGYEFDRDYGWLIREDKEFLPYSLSFSYVPPSKTFYKWAKRISVAPGLNTSVVADLLRPTNSYFLFSPSITFKLHQFMDITFSSTSQNSVLYWYFHNEEGDFYSEWGGFPGNIVKDLIDSFDFGHKEKRENSGFKLKSLNMTVSHDLHDWKFNMTLKIQPRIVTEKGVSSYDFSPYMTIGIVWNPMESFKTSIVDEYGEWKME